jgi:hypothetical protein
MSGFGLEGHAAEQALTNYVTGNFFTGIKPALGRLFVPGMPLFNSGAMDQILDQAEVMFRLGVFLAGGMGLLACSLPSRGCTAWFRMLRPRGHEKWAFAWQSARCLRMRLR